MSDQDLRAALLALLEQWRADASGDRPECANEVAAVIDAHEHADPDYCPWCGAHI